MSESESIINVLIYSVVIPIGVIMILKIACLQAYNFATSLWVNGKPNEWVLITKSSGKMVKAGIGLRCFKGPFDSVATFPAKCYKVKF